MEEIWKPIKGYESFYEVSNLGRVRSLDRIAKTKAGVIKPTKGKLLSLTLKNNYYISVMLCVKDQRKRFHVHRLVADAFVKKIPGKNLVNHINGVKDDNRFENLEWVDYSENAQHAIKTKLTPIGEESTSSKLTEKKVKAIRRLFRINPFFNRKRIAQKLGVGDTTIHKIIRNQRWKHI